ncbi:eukaryotic translation initiation factor 4E-1A [Coprinopsis cinerea okayama7|uniref:Eukaryotic translation initiation factor 4E-1A n=1 Tax=Coprinopsis cinerea (strain Okayama-7 / 130 / ATCC MYA-4618 / FGSC 9003) TaxID=240176 RepID=A8P5B2_COPC7|nr:eukaryotic translation initiation factor 4E-1A [Coprinopsis cinerea okayama7\|eukprot:XP_001838900.1 eukaryotic translation initiation factor 4E-1A [Coprinopsis cinerea okayama7\
MSSKGSTTETPSKPAGAGRLPSLNQLAARINPTPVANGTPSAPRPRLAASVLRTGSTVSLASTAASTTDSMAVNAPTTRSASPAGSGVSGSPQSSNTPVPEGGEALTSEKLDKLNQENADGAPAPLSKKFVKGYKNVPSLDAITARMVRTRQLSIDGTARPPEPELIEDPKTPGVQMKAPEHPLQFPWTIFHDTKAKYPYTPALASGEAPPLSAAPPVPESSSEYEAGLTVIGEFDTVESFWRYFNWLKPPSALEKNSNYHLFKSGIKPMWEDEANANGGKWVLTMKNNPQLLDRCWYSIAMALIGEELEEGDEICGAVVSLRTKVDRIQLWTRSKEDVERLNAIGKKMVKLLDVSEADGIGLEFQYNSDDRPPPNKFLSISALPQTSYRSSFQPQPGTPVGGPGGAFGSFGMGIGGGWKGGAKRG